VQKALLTIARSILKVWGLIAQIAKLDLPTRSPMGISAPVSAIVIKESPLRQPDSLKSESIGRLLVLASTPRLNWDSAITGTFNSRARAFSDRVILDIS
jgi:hypothetical protein